MEQRITRIIGFVFVLAMLIGLPLVNTQKAYATSEVPIDEANFPDVNFRNYVSRNFDKDNDGNLSQDECNEVTKIDVSSTPKIKEQDKVKSLKGIEHFTVLTELNCSGNRLRTLDVSKNTALTHLNCDFNQLTSLDVSKNISLSLIGCHGNQLTSLDVSKNTALRSLDCDLNDLSCLDVSKNSVLTYLSCGLNNLTILDVSKNTALTSLSCRYNNLTFLDIGENPALTSLKCEQNQITSLDVRDNIDLTYLDCSSNQLTSLDVSGNSALTVLVCSGNRLTSIDVSKNSALTEFRCTNNQLTSLDISKNTALKKLYCYLNQLTSLDVSHNTALTELNCSDNQLPILDISKNIALVELCCYNNQPISYNNKLTSLDVSRNTALRRLFCYGNQLRSLDLSHNTALTELHCSSNRLTSLDVSKNSDLTSLGCSSNRLTSLDVRHNTALTSLGCSSNQLTSLDVSKNTALKKLYCYLNQLTSLDVSHNTALTELYCYWSQLTSLDVSKNTELHTVDVSENPLTSVKLMVNDYTKERLSPRYIVSVPKGTSEIKFPKGFKIENIVGTIPGMAINGDSLEWDGITKHTSFQYKLCENPEKIVNVSVDISDNGMPELEEAELLVEKAEEDKTQEAYLVAKAKVDTLRNGYEKSDLEQRLSEVKKVIEEARAKDAAKAHQQHQVPSNNYSSGYITLVPVLEQSKVKGKDKVTMEALMTIGSKNLVRTVDGNVTNIAMDVAAFIEQDRTYIPLRFVGEALGFDVTWDNANRMAILTSKDKVVKVSVDSNVFYVNGEKFESDVKPQIKNSRTMIPVGNFARAIGLKDGENIFWNDKTREVKIIRDIKL